MKDAQNTPSGAIRVIIHGGDCNLNREIIMNLRMIFS